MAGPGRRCVAVAGKFTPPTTPEGEIALWRVRSGLATCAPLDGDVDDSHGSGSTLGYPGSKLLLICLVKIEIRSLGSVEV